MRTIPHVLASAAVTLGLIALASGAHAVTAAEKCRGTIIKESGKFVAAKAKALQKCEATLIAKGPSSGITSPVGGRCNDAQGKTAATIAKAESGFKAKVESACGGHDKICGTPDDIDLASIGWHLNGGCPDLEAKGCDNVILDCGGVNSNGLGITDCLVCMNEKAVDQAMDVYSNDLAPGQFGTGSAINKCQIAISKATTAFLLAKSKILGKCWAAVNANKLTGTCPAADTTGKTQQAIDKAEAKKIATICKACGGADGGCDATVGSVTGSGGSDDLTPSQIGFGTQCPAVTLPFAPGTNCATLDDVDGAPNVIDSLRELILCVDCVTEFKVDCIDRATVPAFGTYPAACNTCVDVTPTGACPTTLQMTFSGPNADLDTGWTGIANDFSIPSLVRLTLAVSGCDNANHPCGECNLNGPIANAGTNAVFDNHRCVDKTWIQCTTNADCTNAGATGPCSFFFGAPLPISAGGIPVCVTSEVKGPITGTVNIEDSSGATRISLIAKPYLGGYGAEAIAQPCPRCVPGNCGGGRCCDDGPRIGQPCTVNGSHIVFGPVSLDCPPFAAAQQGQLPITLPITTGVTTASLSAASPTCRASLLTPRKCFCDTCNNPNEDPCFSDADCPESPVGTPGICGGTRCLGGANAGAACTIGSECDSSTCSIDGADSAPNACTNNICRLNPADTDSAGEAQCTTGPTDTLCSIERYRTCSINNDCRPPSQGGSCPLCAPSQTCISKRRECFPDNGVIGTHCFRGTNNEEPCTTIADCPDQVTAGVFCGGGSATAAGAASVPCGNRSTPKFGALFCVPHTSQPGENTTVGLPGLGRLTLSVKSVLNP